MPKFIDGYRTTHGSRFDTGKLIEPLSESVIRDNLLTSSLDVKKVGAVYPVFVTALQDLEENIPLFTHPLYFKTRDGKQVLATDVRMFLKKKIYDGNLATLPNAFSSRVEFDFARTRAIFNLHWIEGDVESMKSDLIFSTMMFSRWVVDITARTYALDPRDQIIVGIVAAYYYQSLFSEETTYDEETLHKWQIHVSRILPADVDLIREVFGKMPVMKNMESLVEGIKLAADNVRLQNFNLHSMLTQMSNSWYGTKAREIITVALEHPPTWMAIVYSALDEKTYRGSMIFKIAERVGRRGDVTSDHYLKQCQKFLDEYALTSGHQALIHAGMA